MTKNTKSEDGFTLIEILVVVGILSMLIVALTPQLRSAKPTSDRRWRCGRCGRSVGCGPGALDQ